MSLKELLSEQPFSYVETKNGLVQISHRGRLVTTLSGRRAARFVASLSGADIDSVQLAMAKLTGHFKHGSERVAKQHNRNT